MAFAASTIGGSRGGGTSASDIGGAGGAASTDTPSVAPSSTDTTILNPTTRSSRTGLGALPLILHINLFVRDRRGCCEHGRRPGVAASVLSEMESLLGVSAARVVGI